MNRPVTRVAAHHGVPVTPDPIGSALGQLRVVLDVRPQRVLDHRIDRIEVTGLFVWRPGGLLDLGQGCRGVMTDAADVYSYCSLGDAFGYGPLTALGLRDFLGVEEGEAESSSSLWLGGADVSRGRLRDISRFGWEQQVQRGLTMRRRLQ
jgi:hypothetical protein